MFVCAIYVEGCPSLCSLQGRVVMLPARPLSFCTNPVAHAFAVPALCKLRKGRGTLCFVYASETKARATRPMGRSHRRNQDLGHPTLAVTAHQHAQRCRYYGLDSCSKTTSDSECERMTPRLFPSGDQ
jgi:hypothetical protein